jgi:hypothetical protein
VQVKEKYRELVRSGDVAITLQESARKKEDALRAGEASGVFATREAVGKLRSVALMASGQICEQRKEKPKEASHRWRAWLREAYSLRSIARCRLDQQNVDNSFPFLRVDFALEIGDEAVEERLLDLLVGIDQELYRKSARAHGFALRNSIENLQEDRVCELVEQLPVPTVLPT